MDSPIRSISLRLLGTIEAGFPSPAEEELSDTLRIDEWLIENREATFMLKPENNAMIGAGIIAGDLVLLDRSRTPKDGDIVLAEVDDVSALRYFRKRGSRVYLEAAHGFPISTEKFYTIDDRSSHATKSDRTVIVWHLARS
jgi:SOS-response transcriptional repressor LexA